MSNAAQEDPTARARESQREWYGEPLGELFRRLIADLGLNQARLAGVLGLSAPMLSQLMSGQRAKIGNPAVTQRLQELQELAAQVGDGTITREAAAARMEKIRETTAGPVLSTGQRIAVARTARHVVREVQSLLRFLATPEELVRAADTLAPVHPQLAEFLRVYGVGRTDEAIAHFEAQPRLMTEQGGTPGNG